MVWENLSLKSNIVQVIVPQTCSMRLLGTFRWHRYLNTAASYTSRAATQDHIFLQWSSGPTVLSSCVRYW